jgi:hypothetical protein
VRLRELEESELSVEEVLPPVGLLGSDPGKMA